MTDPATLSPQQRFERYQQLRATIGPLEKELDALAPLIRADLQQGHLLHSDTHRAELQASQTASIPVTAFVTQFGSSVALRVASIDNRKVKQLVDRGELAAELVAEITELKARTPALVLKACGGHAQGG